MVSKCRVGMMGTHRNDGMQFTPMSHVDIDDQGSLWFFTNNNSERACNIQTDPSIQLTYAHEADSTYLCIEGTAQLNFDKSKMKELFNPYLKAWFPKGLSDPTISLLVVRPIHVEYWINDENKILRHSEIPSTSMS